MDKQRAIDFIKTEIEVQMSMEELFEKIPEEEQEGFESWRRDWEELLRYVEST